MKYYEVTFTISPCSQDARDLLSALAGEAGFETFEETTDGLIGYVQQPLFDQSALDATLEGFPFENTAIIYNVRKAEDRDWNEQWEQEGFDPIVVRGPRTVIIHDGRHLPPSPDEQLSSPGNQPPSPDEQLPSPVNQPPSPDEQLPAPVTIEIDAHNAFGTGTHETTRMICATLSKLFTPYRVLEGSTFETPHPAPDGMPTEATPRRVLDCGSGTGILGICALKLGAESCVAYDIDEWSVDNTRHNAVINQVDDRLRVLHGDATLLQPDRQGTEMLPHSISDRFDLVMANINRNILLQDMERFVSVMAPHATLIVSGFYESDCTLLESKAQSLGLTHCHTRLDGDWACQTYRLNI